VEREDSGGEGYSDIAATPVRVLVQGELGPLEMVSPERHAATAPPTPELGVQVGLGIVEDVPVIPEPIESIAPNPDALVAP
jgi:hypothetical protein